MTLTLPPFSIAPLAVAPPLTCLHPPLLPFLASGRCFRTWVLITYQFFYLSPSLRSFAPTSVPLPSTFRKLAGMTLTLSVLLQRNTRVFPLLLFTEVMKIARLTSPLLDAPRQSLPRLRYGRRLVLLFHPNQTQKLYTLFFALSLALLRRLPALLISPTVLLPGSRFWSAPLI